MPKVTYIQTDGSQQTIEVQAGMTVMQAALVNGIPGLIAECGGQLVCATCHLFVQSDKLSQLAPMVEYENEMLECTASPRKDNSRLSCQIVVSDELGDLTVWMPDTQV